MNFLRIAAEELIGMFIDDGSLALWSVVLIAIVSVAVLWLGFPALWGGVLLVVGCIADLDCQCHAGGAPIVTAGGARSPYKSVKLATGSRKLARPSS